LRPSPGRPLLWLFAPRRNPTPVPPICTHPPPFVGDQACSRSPPCKSFSLRGFTSRLNQSGKTYYNSRSVPGNRSPVGGPPRVRGTSISTFGPPPRVGRTRPLVPRHRRPATGWPGRGIPEGGDYSIVFFIHFNPAPLPVNLPLLFRVRGYPGALLFYMYEGGLPARLAPRAPGPARPPSCRSNPAPGWPKLAAAQERAPLA